jgi:signal peptidase I
MEPTMHCGKPKPGCRAPNDDRFTAVETKTLRRGQIVVFDSPELALQRCGSEGKFVKRIVGLPGETVNVTDGGAVKVDGRRLPEPYLRGRPDSEPIPGTWQVAADHYFVLGDNRPQSCDSRVYGPIERDSIIGRVTKIERDGKTIRLP